MNLIQKRPVANRKKQPKEKKELSTLKAHFDLIYSPHGWLDCDIIQLAHILLHNENPNIEGFQQPTLGPVRNFNIVSVEFVQILHTGNSH